VFSAIVEVGRSSCLVRAAAVKELWIGSLLNSIKVDVSSKIPSIKKLLLRS
jgi:hypothetical protein